MRSFIKLSSPYVGEEEKAAVCRVLDSHVLNMGIETREFEKELKEFFKREDVEVCCVNSCTSALHLALQAHGIGPGDEVLVPTYTFISSFQAVSATGATPIPCDIDVDDAFISESDAEKRITNKTKAILPVSFAGCDSKAGNIYKLASKYNIHVIEDVAHSFGDEKVVNRAGTLCFSFDAIKNITCSDGGAVITSNKEIANKIKDARLLGVIGDTEQRYSGKRSWNSDTVDQGWRYHMSNICAAIGRAQLAKFDEIRHRRQTFSKMYIEGLKDVRGTRLLPINAHSAVPHIFPIVIENGKRDELKSFLLEHNIESGVQYKPNHFLTKFYKGYSLLNAEELYGKILSIPLHPRLFEDDVSYVIETIKKFFKKCG